MKEKKPRDGTSLAKASWFIVTFYTGETVRVQVPEAVRPSCFESQAMREHQGDFWV